MGFDDPWDINTPGPGESARDGDDRMREMKRAADQRLTTFFPEFASNDPAIDETQPLAVRDGAIKRIALDPVLLRARLGVVWIGAASMDPASLVGPQTVAAAGIKHTDTVIVKQNPANTGVFMFVSQVFDNGFELSAILATVADAPDSAVEFTVIRTLAEDF